MAKGVVVPEIGPDEHNHSGDSYGQADLAAERAVPASDPQTQLGQAMLDQQAQINSYRWLNHQAGTRAIPIERAMELVAREMAAEQERDKKGGKP